MNRNLYRLVFSAAAGMMVPLAETARGRGKAASASALVGVLLAGVVLANEALAEMPRPSTVLANPGFVSAGQAAYQVNGNQAFVNQVGNKSILNWQSFNLSAGNNVQFRQVDSLATNNLVQGASFTSLNRIWDNTPSVIAGSISQGAGQKANVILVNTNGMAFMGGSQVNLNSFTASSLNIDDTFLLDALLGDKQKPQYEGTGGFIKVFEGARITAGSQGRVLLVAPTVVNRGTVDAPDGQVILAAGTKVYLRSVDDANLNVNGLLVEVDSPTGLSDFNTANASVKDGQLDGKTVMLTNEAQDKLGHATNLGELSTPRGNVTMVGYAVNQSGIARATTSVVANGSVYLLAKDTSAATTGNVSRDSTRGGQVVLGANSRTEVLPEVNDTTATVDGNTGTGLAKSSEVRVLGQTIYMAGGAAINAPAARVDLMAVDNPMNLKSTLGEPSTAASTMARVHVASGARINVAGLTDVEVSAARNAVEVELRGDELKDSPVNQQGPLRGEKAFVDINRALANANAGKATLIAKDSLEAYQGKLERTVVERSTAGGAVTIRSQGETILEAGAVVDLSGGNLNYTPAHVKTTQLVSAGVLTDLADASAETRYDGIATRFVIDYKRWNQKDVIDLGQSMRYDPGYTEGKNAGSLNIESRGAAYMQAVIEGRTTVGELQGASGTQPKGATFRLGTPLVEVDGLNDYKLNQKVVIDRTLPSLPAGFGMGDALSDALKETLAVDAALVAKDKVANLTVYTNQSAEVRAALRAPQGGGVTIVANNLLVKADINTPGGTIKLAAGNNVFVRATDPLSLVDDPLLRVAEGVHLSARGAWVNERPGVAAGDASLPLLDGGSISLAADAKATSKEYYLRGTVALGQGVTVDASGGARVSATGKVTAGKGGTISLAGYAVEGVTDNLLAYGLTKGGKINLTANRIKIGGVAESDFGTLMFDPLFFTSGGFGDFGLTALTSLEVAQNTVIRPQVVNRELFAGYALQPTGGKLADFSQLAVLDDQVRQAANLSLAAKQSSVGTGEILIGKGARIEVDPKGTIALEARNTIDMEGALVARGGAINVVLDRSTGEKGNSAPNQNALWLGKDAVLDVSGIARTYTDTKGLTQGEVLAGGTVNLNARTGYVVAEEGSRITLAGAAPVRLDVANESGGLGRTVGSDAGVLSVFAEEGILLDATLAAQGGSAGNRGGEVTIALSKNAHTESQIGFDAQARVLSLAPSVSSQSAGLSPDAPIPITGVVRARIGADKLEAAGFDRMRLSSRDAIVLEDSTDLGASRALALRELTLDAARIATAGGNAVLAAETLRLGNYDPTRVGAQSAVTDTGTLTLNARQLELAGKLRLEGMARAELNGLEAIELAGVTTGLVRPVGELNAVADLAFHGAIVAPTTYTQYSIQAPGQSVSFTRSTDTPTQPLSALGSLTVVAQDIVQGGNLWAPFGQIDFRASESLAFKSGSLSSVAAAPGSLTPFGKVLNGRTWVYDVDPANVPAGQLEQTELAGKSIRTSGKTVDMQAGAQLNVSGGGDLQAHEFTVGPGGSRDILTDANTYAILPGYAGGVAPIDAQEMQGFKRAAGDAVYLSGVKGLADGVYTLLPAHYALLPGAYAVKLNTGIKNLLAGQAYSRQDGVTIAAGYVTDSRANAPKDANWSGIQVLTRDQVLARSEFTLTKASDFFAAGNNRPQDAGLLSFATNGTGSDSLKLDAIYNLAASSGGRGAAVDISAPNLAITSGSPSGIDPSTTQIDVDKINALGATSLVVGGTRSAVTDTTTQALTTSLTVNAQILTLANDASHALKAAEVILAAKDTLSFKSGSVVDAQGDAGDAGRYTTVGNGALVRAASTTATFERSGSADRVLDRTGGTLVGDTSTLVRAADSITLDATRENAFKGVAEFRKNGTTVAGNLAVGATRVNFGATPANAQGVTYSQSDLDGLNSLSGLALTSYSTFDLYGDVNVGGVDAHGQPTLENLTLQGAGLAGLDNSGKTANLRAKNITLLNPTTTVSAHAGTSGNGTLAILADTLTLGDGDKSVQGFNSVTITANELAGAGTGTTTIAAPTTLKVARIRGDMGADQTLRTTGALAVVNHIADRALAPVTALGAKWSLAGTSVDFSAQAVLPSGQFRLNASDGDLTLGPDARVDVAGRDVRFFDVTRPTWGGRAEFTSATGNVSFARGSNVDVSAALGADAGTLVVRAVKGAVTLADGSVTGNALPDADGQRGEGARFELDVNSLPNFSALNAVINQGEFDGARSVRVRTGDLNVAASDSVRAHDIKLAADGGKLTVLGELNTDGREGGSIELYSGNRLTVAPGAKLSARALQTGGDGGSVVLGSTREDTVLAGGSIDTAGAPGGTDGEVLIRASRLDNVAFTNLYAPIPDTGTANSYAVSLSGVTGASMVRGLVVAFVPKFNNTTSSKLNLSGAGAKDIWYNGAAVTANRIKAKETVYMVYDGTRFNIVDAAFANRTATTILGTATKSGTTTNYVANQSGLTSYKTGQTVVYTPDTDSTTTTNKLNVNGLGAKDIKYNNVNLAAGFLKAGEPVYLVYDGTAFQVALEANAPRARGTATALEVTSTRALSAGNSYAFVANANSAAGGTTLTVNGVAALLLKDGAKLAAADIKANDLVYATYDGTSFHMLAERAAKVDVGQGVRVTSVAGDYTKAIRTSITGASSIAVEAVRTYDAPAINGGGVLDTNSLSADIYRYLPTAGRNQVKARLAGTAPAFDVSKFHLRPGTEIQFKGNVVLPRDINLAQYRYGDEPGVLTVRAQGNLTINENLSDGFSHATPFTTPTGSTPATLVAGDSWSYRLVAGADMTAADPLAVAAAKDFTLAAGKLIRTGTGDIQVASGNDIKLSNTASVIYTAGRAADPVLNFKLPINSQRAFFTQDGGDVSLAAAHDIIGTPSAQLYSDWLFRQGRLNDDGTGYATTVVSSGAVTPFTQGSPAWWVRFDLFKQGVGALGGGDVSISAAGKVENLSASAPTQGRMASITPDPNALVKTGGGTVRVEAGTDLLGGQYYADEGDVALKVGGTVGSGQIAMLGNIENKPVYTILALGDGEARVRAQDDVNIHTILNPHLLTQLTGETDASNVNTQKGDGKARESYFSTYSQESGVSLASLNGNVTLHSPGGSGNTKDWIPGSVADLRSVYKAASEAFLPPSLSIVSFQGDVVIHDQPTGTSLTLLPGVDGQLELLAQNSVRMNASITMSDSDPAGLASPARPVSINSSITNALKDDKEHAVIPVHIADATPVRIYANSGDVQGVSQVSGKFAQLVAPKSVAVRAGRDVRDFSVRAQNLNVDDRSVIEAGRDVVFSAGSTRTDSDGISVGGPGRLEVTAGRTIDLGTSGGIVSRGDLDNVNLPSGGADIQVVAGSGATGLDVVGAINRLQVKLEAGASDEPTLWLARWLTDNSQLNAGNALTEVRALAAQGAEVQRDRVRALVFTALRETGRDANKADSGYAGDFARGYAALDLVFPGIGEKNQNGSFKNYQGDINLFASRIKTERGGNVEFMVPGGDLIVGLANTPGSLVNVGSNVLGIVAAADGDIKGFSRGNMLVNQSRILTVGGGDVMLWSSEGDIDAGKGKKTASAVPPPIIKVDSQGNVTLELQGAASGSGIGALSSGGVTAGDVDLIAPKGTVNAGDAGIRAGNLNIAALVVLGADNISVSGRSAGTPVADTSAVTASASGATSGGDDVSKTTAALSQSAADSAKTAQTLKDAFKPSFVRVEVLGFGE